MPTLNRKLVAAHLTPNFREATELVEEPLPTPAAGEIVVKNLIVGVNASDVRATLGMYFPGKEPPINLGAEAVAQIIDLGDGVTNFNIGDYVVVSEAGKGYCEYAVHRAKHALPIDEPKAEYLSLVVSGLTASIGLNVTGEMTSGETVLVTAAAGGTGQYAVQLAKMAGNHVIGTCSTDEKAAFLRSLGCDRPINYKKEKVKEVLKAEYPKGIDLIYESVGGEMFDISMKALAKKGRLVIIGYISEYDDARPEVVSSPRIYNYLLWKSASVRGMFLPDYYLEHFREHLPMLTELYKSGQLHIEIDQTKFQGLSQVADAVEYLHAGKNVGKVVVYLDNPS